MIQKQQNPFEDDYLCKAWNDGYSSENLALDKYYENFHFKIGATRSIKMLYPDPNELSGKEYTEFLNIKSPYENSELNQAWNDGRSAFIHDKNLIPLSSHYCYTRNEDGKCVTCPFWGIKITEDDRIGICSFLGVSDETENSGGLLYDQCKECGINTNDETEIEEIE